MLWRNFIGTIRFCFEIAIMINEFWEEDYLLGKCKDVRTYLLFV